MCWYYAVTQFQVKPHNMSRMPAYWSKNRLRIILIHRLYNTKNNTGILLPSAVPRPPSLGGHQVGLVSCQGELCSLASHHSIHAVGGNVVAGALNTELLTRDLKEDTGEMRVNLCT